MFYSLTGLQSDETSKKVNTEVVGAEKCVFSIDSKEQMPISKSLFLIKYV